jgi:hypothetical protein
VGAVVGTKGSATTGRRAEDETDVAERDDWGEI